MSIIFTVLGFDGTLLFALFKQRVKTGEPMRVFDKILCRFNRHEAPCLVLPFPLAANQGKRNPLNHQITCLRCDAPLVRTGTVWRDADSLARTKINVENGIFVYTSISAAAFAFGVASICYPLLNQQSITILPVLAVFIFFWSWRERRFLKRISQES